MFPLLLLFASACVPDGRYLPPEICDNGRDDDKDDLLDCADPDCEYECAEFCGDGEDNDGDLLVDCLDPDCDGFCPEADGCEDERDNDGDGKIDCEDPDCEACPFEICDDGFDNDGNGLVDCLDPACTPACDGDGDGFVSTEVGGPDCDDTDATVRPDTLEICNGIDDDCDGRIDDDDPILAGPTPYYADRDGDGAGDVNSGRCTEAPDHVTNADDCDDEDPAVALHLAEVCDGVDNDCDGIVDASDPSFDGEWRYEDLDGDGHGNLAAPTCLDGPGTSELADDCDDNDPFAWDIGGPERCDGRDNDCDGLVDLADPDTRVRYVDGDNDGWGDLDRPSCKFSGTAKIAGDCDDFRSWVHPEAPELCDGVDNDCDGLIDAFDPDRVHPSFLDRDGDGFGDPSLPACSTPVLPGTDCDDTNPANYPGNPEICDGVDNDCDGVVDLLDPDVDLSSRLERYTDNDGDGFGDPASIELLCSHIEPWHVSRGDDCDDTKVDVFPGATEVCDGIDNDCDQLVDDDDSDVDALYLDLDGDGFGTLPPTCDPAATTANADDCDDTDADVNPDATEVCDGIDNDCDNRTDTDQLDLLDWYPTWDDVDGDGFGDPATFRCSDTRTDIRAGDCDDNAPDVYPLAPEDCDDAVDQDCDGFADCPCDIVVGVLPGWGMVWHPKLPWNTPNAFAASGDCPVTAVELSLPVTLADLQSQGITVVMAGNPSGGQITFFPSTVDAIRDFVEQGHGGLVVSYNVYVSGHDNRALVGIVDPYQSPILHGASFGTAHVLVTSHEHPVFAGLGHQPVLFSGSQRQNHVPGPSWLTESHPSGVMAREQGGRAVWFTGFVEYQRTPEGEQALYNALKWASGW